MSYVQASPGGADLGIVRLGGPGLGNLLFPWGRAQCVALERDLSLVATTWPQVKIGPVMRGERDYRWYGGLFRPEPGSVTGTERLSLMMRGHRVGEDDREILQALGGGGGKPIIVTTRGMGNEFRDLVEHRRWIRSRLRSISKVDWGGRLSRGFEKSIGIHVRRGDFEADPDRRRSRAGVSNQRLPLGWYRRALEHVREVTDCVQTVVFSDAPNKELKPILGEDGVERVRLRNALEEIWGLSMCGWIIASGSTFSGWAAYLSRSPVTWPSGQIPEGLGGMVSYCEELD